MLGKADELPGEMHKSASVTGEGVGQGALCHHWQNLKQQKAKKPDAPNLVNQGGGPSSQYWCY